MNSRVHTLLMRLIVTGMVLGMLGMIQPFSLDLFKPGFLLAFYSTLAYIVVSHITPRASNRP